jgi:hypothetical protein
MELTLLRAVGDAALGLIGSTRYAFTIDNLKNKEFVALWQKEHGTVPDTFEGEQWQALQVLAAAIEKAKSTDTKALHERAALARPVSVTTPGERVRGVIVAADFEHKAQSAARMVPDLAPLPLWRHLLILADSRGAQRFHRRGETHAAVAGAAHPIALFLFAPLPGQCVVSVHCAARARDRFPRAPLATRQAAL